MKLQLCRMAAFAFLHLVRGMDMQLFFTSAKQITEQSI